MAKKQQSGSTRSRVSRGSAKRQIEDSRQRFERLLAERSTEALGRDGVLQVALALAAATRNVRVNAAVEPFEATPTDLISKTLDDPAIGLDRAGVAAFKANLAQLLPAIKGDVRSIPDNPAVSVQDVARFVALSMAAARRAEAGPGRLGGLTVLASSALKEARERCKDRYGSHFAAKASDATILTLARGAAQRERGMAAAGAPAPGGALILELTPTQAPPRPTPREGRGKLKVLRDAARLVDRETRDRHVGAPQIFRQTNLATIRDAFYKSVAPLYAEIGKRVGVSSGRELNSTSSALDMCWLNGTIRTAAGPSALADVVADKQVERVDLPQRLVREMRLCAPLVGAPVFRTRTGKDGTGIIVAVIDGEVDVRHPALAGRVMQKRNLTKEPFGFPDEHGTAVAGIIGSADKRFTGIAPGVSILNYKVFSTDPALDSDDFNGALAIQQALEDGAHVVNCSWGAGPAGNGTSRQARACDNAWGLGLVVVKSAGNAGPGARTLTTPADAEGVIVVGATDRRGQSVQSYSSRGPAGTRARPHLVAPGGSDTSGIETCLPGGSFGSAGAGTSFAAPQVSGLAALLLDDDPDLAPDAVRKSLIDSCSKIGGGADTEGAGLVKLK
jgi:serine protease AprX